MSARWLAITAWLLSSAALGQDLDEQDLEALAASSKALNAGHYLASDRFLAARAFDAKGKVRSDFLYDQWRQARSMITGEAPHPQPRSREGIRLDATETAELAAATPGDAIAAIVDRARDTTVVILNEDHNRPRSRAFGLLVARALRPLGYDILALETLQNVADDAASAAAMTKLAADGYARATTGFYTKDPVFADFLRQSLALGYRPVAYETTDHHKEDDRDASIARREQSEADYLVARVLKSDPHAKMLIYVGFSHAAEEPQHRDGSPDLVWLAARLKRMTGIDPLTIDQTTIVDAPALKTLTRPTVLTLDGKPLAFGRNRELMDLQVFHPNRPQVAGRPAWLAGMGRHREAIPKSLLPTSGERLVQAFVVGEGDGAIPIDQVLVTAGKPAPPLMLPQAPVRYTTEDAR